MHREPDGTLCAIARWPSREAWAAGNPPIPDDDADAEAFTQAIIEAFPTLTMDVIEDRWESGPTA
jgi:hypothetical protein